MPGLSEPRWWYAPEPTWQATFLQPISAIVGWIASRRIRRTQPYRSQLPVICVGNFTAGGSGKTPLALLIADVVSNMGRTPFFLSRGYGGKLSGPVRVDPARHFAGDVGDEPLLLSMCAATVVSRNRRQGAEFIEGEALSNTVIIMDDGLQNPSLAKDLVIAVVDRKRGIGNGRVFPSGPLRAPIENQLGLPQLFVLTGRTDAELRPATTAFLTGSSVPKISATTRASTGPEHWRGRRVLAYAGIANPDRFFDMLEELGAQLVERRRFADHHAFSEREARELLDSARLTSSTLVTTEKDYVRLPDVAALGELKSKSETLRVQCVMADADLGILRALIAKAISK